ncbi:hypothetical protein MTO96_035618 [Rhipicephalus appendiculatus]
MYPSDYCDYLFYTDVYANHGRIRANYRSWFLFKYEATRRRNMEFGISFSWSVTPDSLDEMAGALDTLRKDGIKHYGLLTVVTSPNEYYSTVSSMRGNIAKLKQLQGSDRSAKTVLAFGPYVYSVNNLGTIKAAFNMAVR